MLRVTLDTNVLNPEGRSLVEAACLGCDVEIVHTTVSDREQENTPYAATPAALMETAVWGESRWDRSVWGGSPIPETLVLGESRFGKAVLGGDDTLVRFEAILAIINGDRHFPPIGKRDSLNEKQRRRLRDAMTLEAHTREARDVFVTDDEKDFIKGGRRQKLQALCSTRILTIKEFCDWMSPSSLHPP